LLFFTDGATRFRTAMYFLYVARVAFSLTGG